VRTTGGGGQTYARSSGPVYAADRPEWWPTAMAAGRALECSRSSVVWALATGRTLAGRRLAADPPAWRLAELAEAERQRRERAWVRPGRRHEGCEVWAGPPGPGWRDCERRYAERDGTV